MGKDSGFRQKNGVNTGDQSNYKLGSYPRFQAVVNGALAAPSSNSIPPGSSIRPEGSIPPGSRRRFLGKMASDQQRRTFEKAMEQAKEEGAIICSHISPDSDALCSSYAIWRWLNLTLEAKSAIDIAVSRPLPMTELLITTLEMPLIDWEIIDSSDKRPLIVVDTNSSSQISPADKRDNPLILMVDHHRRSDMTLHPKHSIVNEEAKSTCELIASLIPADDIDARTAMALAAGISSDSARLDRASDDTLQIFLRLRGMSDMPYERIHELAFPSLKRVILNALMDELAHARRFIHKDRLVTIVTTHIKPPAIMAELMRTMDVDVAIAMSPVSMNLHQLSIRVSQKQAYGYGIHASQIAAELGDICGIGKDQRGGHLDMAGGTFPGHPEDLADKISDVIARMINRALA